MSGMSSPSILREKSGVGSRRRGPSWCQLQAADWESSEVSQLLGELVAATSS